MSSETSSGVTVQDLGAYFDGELPADQAEAIARVLESDAQLRAEHLELGALSGAVRATLEVEAQAVPAARFEQIWDEIDRAIERDARLQAEADRNASIWTRLWAALRPVRIPVLAATAAAAVTLVIVGNGSDEPNNSPSMASVDQDPTPAPAPAPALPDAPSPEPTKIAKVDPGSDEPAISNPTPTLTPMPVPDSSEVEIHGIEFGGNGSISNTGTVTVLYVEEDEEPTTNERSL